MKVIIKKIELSFVDESGEEIESQTIEESDDKVVSEMIYNVLVARSAVYKKTMPLNSTNISEILKIEKNAILMELKGDDYSKDSKIEELTRLLKVRAYEYYKLEQRIRG